MDYPEIEEKLKYLYYNPNHPASFSSLNKLYFYAKPFNISLNDVKLWLQKQNTYTLHKQINRNFQRNKFIVKNINEQFQADIVDMQKFSNKNSGFKYILTVIDLFSKFAFAIPLKTKSANEVLEALKKVFKIRQPFKLQTDKGKEFINAPVQKFLKELKVEFFTSNNEKIKCSLVERLNKTLKSKMWKYFTSKGTTKWIDVIEKIVNAYNNSIHRIIKMKPIDVNDGNDEIVFKNIYGFDNMRSLLKTQGKQIKFKNNESVRIPYKQKDFEKGYYPVWQDQIYKIKNIQNNAPYKNIKVVDQQGKVLDKRFYPQEIQKVKEDYYRIEKVIRKRKNKGKIEYLIKWLGYPETYNTWEPAENIKKLNG
ncbi:MAG: DDE-type integrase/transposase/recombinase [Limnohabitans sp.]|nr:DDE-type integrase/transposase/recombinase [Limnohabitans sp.]